MEAAARLRMRGRVVLPFSREAFRRTSVVDRPGDWGARYDRVLDRAEKENDLVVLAGTEGDSEAYVAANSRILDEAASVAAKLGLSVVAVVVWDQRSRGPSDTIEHFLKESDRRHLEVLPILTL